MNPADLDDLLRRTFADHTLSGSERQTLLGWVQAHIKTDAHRGTARSRAFTLARDSARDESTRKVLTWLEEVLKVVDPVSAPSESTASGESLALFSPGDACLGQIVHRFAAARRTVDICVFTITDDRITRALLDAHRRGVRIRVITDNEKAFDAGSDIERIAEAKVPVRVDRTPYHMHHKFAIFDGVRLLNGSYNWTRGAAEQNAENIIETGEPRLVSAFSRQFETLWAELSD